MHPVFRERREEPRRGRRDRRPPAEHRSLRETTRTSQPTYGRRLAWDRSFCGIACDGSQSSLHASAFRREMAVSMGPCTKNVRPGPTRPDIAAIPALNPARGDLLNFDLPE